MKKTVVFILSVIFLGIANLACDKSKTMQEYIREEKKAIERYIDRYQIVVLNEYPKDSLFKENEYFKTNSGLYMHVVDRGNTGRRIVPLKEVALIRFDYRFDIKTFLGGTTDSIAYPYLEPLELIYGLPGSYSGLVCEGFAIPLAYVGEGAVVDLLIPSQIGSTTDNGSFNPVFYKNLKYTKFD